MSGAPFFYDLPEDRIAQRPVRPYDSARLLVVQRKDGKICESLFSDLGVYLRAEDLLVFNDSKVIPARLVGRLESGGEVEVLLHRRLAGEKWRCLGQPLKKFTAGRLILFASGLCARVGRRVSEYEVELEFAPCGSPQADTRRLLEEAGTMPVPPYIRKGRGDEKDRLDYQSMFARVDGSVAAPTASLHFTPALMQRLELSGVQSASLTLHVGAASFLPLWHEHDTEPRKPGEERYVYQSAVLDAVQRTRSRGGRVVAVGTTVVRALESMARVSAAADGAALSTELFITPGHRFLSLDAVITNFHQPRTTHLLLVQAFLGGELLERSYQHALAHEFRFLSYGDGMLLL